MQQIQENVRLALSEDDVTAGQIVEIFRETLRMEADAARTLARKAQTAVEKCNTNPFYQFPDYLNQPNLTFGTDSISFAAKNDGLMGGLADDVLSL